LLGQWDCANRNGDGRRKKRASACTLSFKMD